MSEPVRSALHELTVARTKEFLRQGEAVFWVFAFPILLALALGFAFRNKAPDRVPIGIVSGGGSVRVATLLAGSPGLRVRSYTEEAGLEALRRGKISLLVHAGSPVVYRFDPTRPDSRIARLEADETLQRAAGRRDSVPVSEVRVAEKGARYIDFLLPGLLGMNLMGTGMWGVGFSVATARMQKLLKRLVATPMRKSDFFLSQITMRLLLLVVEVSMLVGFGWVVFDVSVRGSLPVLAVVCIAGGIAFSGLGLLVASRAETIEAVSGWMNLVMLPMWLLSGVFFSSERFPDAAQPFIRALPLTALNEALRGVWIDGAGLASVLPQLAILAVWTMASFFVGLRIFKWK